MPASKKRPRGRPLRARTDTERLDLLVELVGFGRKRGDVSLGFGGDDHDGPLELHAGPAGEFQVCLADDAGGDLRRVLDRALSSSSASARRELAAAFRAAARRRRERERAAP